MADPYTSDASAVRIMWYLHNQPEPSTITEIAKALEANRETVKSTLGRLYVATKQTGEPYIVRERRVGVTRGGGEDPYEYDIGRFTEDDCVPPPRDGFWKD